MTYVVPMTTVVYFDADGKVESSWDFFDVADFSGASSCERRRRN